MKYEFRVGDYVEMADGFVSWVCQVRDDGYIWVANKDNASYCYCIPEELRYFNRIGLYDFTKNDDGKIKPFQVNTALTEYASIFAMSDKINELVDAVNSIREELNNG